MRTKPILRGVIHELAFSAAVSAGILLVATARSGEAKLGVGLHAASLAGLALLRFTNGQLGVGLTLGASLLLWLVVPVLVAIRRLRVAAL